MNWSIGEELSLRHVVGLEWSPPGLARFSGCALAILHSNHVLALWECVGQTHIRDKWRRCLIVNKVVQAYYGTSITDDVERRQVRQRIRSFAWAPAVQTKHKAVDRLLDPHLAQREHFLAVSTDAREILILRVQSPHDALASESSTWGAKIVYCLKMPSETSRDVGATAMTFSDWHKGAQAKFAYIAGGRVYACDAEYESTDAEPRIVLSAPAEIVVPLSSDLSGPLKFAPKSASLLFTGPDTVYSIDTSAEASREPLSHHLDGRWDDLSGLAFTADANANLTVNIASHLSTTSSATTDLSVALESNAEFKEPSWQNAIHESKQNFSASYDLGANVQERTWGIASSPLGDSVATCITLLPSDSPAHIIQSEQRCSIAITTSFESKETPFPIEGGRSPPQDISTETILYGLRQFLARGSKVDDTEQRREATKQYVRSTFDLPASTQIPPLPWNNDDEEPFEVTPENIRICFVNTRALLYYDERMFDQRLNRLIDAVVQRPLRLQLTRDEYLHITRFVLTLPSELRGAGPLSRKIGTAFKAVSAKIEGSGAAVDPTMTDAASFVETCNICHQEVKFESLRWSRCTGGHQFSRCSLTFLSIMEPGISKSCRICSALYLNEDALPEFQGSAANGVKAEMPSAADGMSENVETDGLVEDKASLARLLFAACNVCFLCGGKFVA